MTEARTVPTLVGVGRARAFFPELESLRGIAVLLVFLLHATGMQRPFDGGSWLASWLVATIRDPRVGVDVFFVLSGFLISLPFVQAARGGPRVVLRDYFTRRALRILPLYATAVVVGTVATSNRAADLVRAVPYLVFANSVMPIEQIRPWSGVWWSLGTEVQFYLMLPLIAWIVRTRPRWGAALVVAWVAGYVVYLTGRLSPRDLYTGIVVHCTVLCRAPLFAGGAFAAWVFDRYGGRARRALHASTWARNGGADAVFLVVLGSLAAFFRWYGGLTAAELTPVYQARDVVDAAALTIVLLLILLAPLRCKPLLSNPVLARLGIVSYSIYLIHGPLLIAGLGRIRVALPALDFRAWSWPAAAAIASVGLVCVGLAEITFRGIERPFLRRKARFDAPAAPVP